jgi:hypothetical protein
MNQDITKSDDARQIRNAASQLWLNPAQGGESLADDREPAFHCPTKHIIRQIVLEALACNHPGDPIGCSPRIPQQFWLRAR